MGHDAKIDTWLVDDWLGYDVSHAPWQVTKSGVAIIESMLTYAINTIEFYNFNSTKKCFARSKAWLENWLPLAL